MNRVLMNSAMMPGPGTYRLRRVSRDEFVSQMKRGFVSYIGYPETAAFLERISGMRVPVNRGETVLVDGATMLICKLVYRLANPGDKGKFTPRDEDYEFLVCTYSGGVEASDE